MKTKKTDNKNITEMTVRLIQINENYIHVYTMVVQTDN